MLIKPQVFESAIVGQSVVYAIKKTDDANAKNKDMDIILVQDKGEISKRNYFLNNYSQNYFKTIEYNRFRMLFSRNVYDLIVKIESGKPKLHDYYRGYSGIIAKGGKTVLSAW